MLHRADLLPPECRVQVLTRLQRLTDELHKHINSGASTGVLMALIHEGAEVDLRDQANKTPLMRAAADADVKRVDLLLGLGAQLTLQDSTGNTALHHAASSTSSRSIRHISVTFAARCQSCSPRSTWANCAGKCHPTLLQH